MGRKEVKPKIIKAAKKRFDRLYSMKQLLSKKLALFFIPNDDLVSF